MADATALPTPAGIALRRPTEADYPGMVRVIDDWWGGRTMDALLPRLWLQHFTGTSWLAETTASELAGFLIGFHSPDRANVAYCRLVATNPNLRGRGVGRALYERFFDDARRAGRHEVRAITWPGNRPSIAFHRALGFQVEVGPGSQNLYGTPAQPGYDFDREDRTILVRTI
ncbi:MAG: GNAT family N-acetyltransferase [Chloroflexi bacterium]|nr:GNAT family N-acetyltransferase [Chloroflexota bacterium]